MMEGLDGGFGNVTLASSLFKIDLFPCVLLIYELACNKESILSCSSELELEPSSTGKKPGRASRFLPESSGLANGICDFTDD